MNKKGLWYVKLEGEPVFQGTYEECQDFIEDQEHSWRYYIER